MVGCLLSSWIPVFFLRLCYSGEWCHEHCDCNCQKIHTRLLITWPVSVVSCILLLQKAPLKPTLLSIFQFKWAWNQRDRMVCRQRPGSCTFNLVHLDGFPSATPAGFNREQWWRALLQGTRDYISLWLNHTEWGLDWCMVSLAQTGPIWSAVGLNKFMQQIM